MTNSFYIGLNPRWQKYNWLPPGLNVMYSAAGFWDNGTHEWRDGKFIKQAKSRWLDMGGFTLLNRFGDYPFSIDNALNLVARLKPHFYASLDYPCEPEIARSLALTTNRERIKATVVNACQIMELADEVKPSELVPVMQGYILDEYKYCIDLHHQTGTIRDYMAVGSMCRRINSQELHRLIPGIYEYARLAGVKRLHFFGLKLSKDLVDLSEFIYSRDSAVALDDYSAELREQRQGRRFPRGKEEKQQAFQTFFSRLQMLNLNYTS